MRVVGVHLADEVRPFLDRALETRDIRGAEPHLAGALHEHDPSVFFHQVFYDLRGAVRRVVVYDEDMELPPEPEYVGDNYTYVLRLVVGGDYDYDLHGRYRGLGRVLNLRAGRVAPAPKYLIKCVY